MELSDVTRIAELCLPSEVNEYLDLGWKIVRIYTTTYDTEPPRCYHQTAHYVMAWLGADPQFPKKEPLPGIIEF